MMAFGDIQSPVENSLFALRYTTGSQTALENKNLGRRVV